MRGVSLSQAEKKIFNLLIKKNGEAVNLDDLIEHMEDGKKISRHSMIVRMKYLAAKLAPMGWILSQESKLGRGATTHYKATKRF